MSEAKNKVSTGQVFAWSFWSILAAFTFFILFRGLYQSSSTELYGGYQRELRSFEISVYERDLSAYLFGLDNEASYYGHARQSAEVVKKTFELENDPEKIARTLRSLSNFVEWMSIQLADTLPGEDFKTKLTSKVSELLTLAEKNPNESVFKAEDLLANTAFLYLCQDFNGNFKITHDFVLRKLTDFFRRNDGNFKSSKWLVPLIEQMKEDWLFMRLVGWDSFKYRLSAFKNKTHELPVAPKEVKPIAEPKFWPRLHGWELSWIIIGFQFLAFLFYLVGYHGHHGDNVSLHSVNYRNPVVWFALLAFWPGVVIACFYYLFKFIWEARQRLVAAQADTVKSRDAKNILGQSRQSLRQLEQLVK